MTRKWIEVNNHLWDRQYSVNKNIRFESPILKSDLCGHSDGKIVVKGRMTAESTHANNRTDKTIALKTNAPFILCEINSTFINNAEDFDTIMPMHNLWEYSENYSLTSGNFLNYYRDKLNNNVNQNYAIINRKNNNKWTTGKHFECKREILRKTSSNNKRSNVKVVCSLDLWRSLHLPLINCKIEFDLTSSKDCITYEISRTDAMVAKTPNLTGVAIETTGSIFQMNSAKLYVPVVTLSINENNF